VPVRVLWRRSIVWAILLGRGRRSLVGEARRDAMVAVNLLLFT
jgi:hypothetical protein